MSNYTTLAAIDVSKHTEKKGPHKLEYLSWPIAVDFLMKADPTATWEFHEPQTFSETMMVSCTVTAFGKRMNMHLPVMDHSNKAIKNPNSFDVNKAMMRCLVKAIACHGLGISVYAGEDLPTETPAAPTTIDITDDLIAIEESGDLDELQKIFTVAYNKARAYPDALQKLTEVKDRKKKILGSLGGQ
jgi:hypothetical protein